MSDPIRNLTLSLLVLSAAPALARAQTPVDTVITVQPGGRLEVENFQGSVTIGTWDRNAVRVVAGRVGCSDDARSRLQAGTGRAFFALLEDAATIGGTVSLAVTWDEERVTAEVRCEPPPSSPVLTTVDSHHDLADGHELLDDGRSLRLWVHREALVAQAGAVGDDGCGPTPDPLHHRRDHRIHELEAIAVVSGHVGAEHRHDVGEPPQGR